MAQNPAAAVETPIIQGSAEGGSHPPAAPERRLLGRRKSQWVSDLHIKLDATDARALSRLREAYGRDGATLIRDLIREKYADLYEEGPDATRPDPDPYGTPRGR